MRSSRGRQDGQVLSADLLQRRCADDGAAPTMVPAEFRGRWRCSGHGASWGHTETRRPGADCQMNLLGCERVQPNSGTSDGLEGKSRRSRHSGNRVARFEAVHEERKDHEAGVDRRVENVDGHGEERGLAGRRLGIAFEVIVAPDVAAREPDRRCHEAQEPAPFLGRRWYSRRPSVRPSAQRPTRRRRARRDPRDSGSPPSGSPSESVEEDPP